MYVYEPQGLERPAAPFIQVKLQNPDDSIKSMIVRGLLDTGSDGTLVPIKYLQSIGVRPGGRATNLYGSTGHFRKSFPYYINFGIGDDPPKVVKVWTWDGGDFILVGRDILNKKIIKFNGPKEFFEILVS